LKRHQALEQLSRDHHRALVAAQALKRASESTAADARDRFLSYWDPEGRWHFRQEEEILLPACARFIDPEHPLIAKVLTDHVRIRHLASEAATSGVPAAAALHELGRELEKHVRREERELFPLIEQSLPNQELARLVDLLTR
jgi:hemerythrin-like domain-containing protein